MGGIDGAVGKGEVEELGGAGDGGAVMQGILGEFNETVGGPKGLGREAPRVKNFESFGSRILRTHSARRLESGNLAPGRCGIQRARCVVPSRL